MALFLYFLVFLCQTASTESQCNVTQCDPGFCTDNVCTKCFQPYFKDTFGKCEQCYLSCRECHGVLCYHCAHDSCDACIANCTCSTNNIACQECPDGYFLSGSRCYKCYFSACKCSRFHNCIGCLPGGYGVNNTCTNTCPNDCATCIGSNACAECVAGKYGSICQSDCITTCQDGTCDKQHGNCSDGCPTNYYLDSETECKACPYRCSSCIDYSHCTFCKQTYNWGSACQFDCNGCNGACQKVNGCASGCNDKYYHAYSENKKGFECIGCPETCKTCYNATLCISCDSENWGSYCQHSCIGCRSDCKKDDGCSEKCNIGYYPHQVDNGNVCKECFENCENCTNDNTCENCKQGYFVANSKNCENCPVNCINSSCDTKAGTCTEGCIVGLSGQRCGQECSQHCLQCEQFHASSCNACKVGFYGDSCTSKCNNCKQSICLQENGACEYGCAEGFTGVSCVEKTGSDESPLANGIAVPIGAGAASVVVVIVVVVVVVLLLRRRRVTSKQDPQEENISLEQANSTPGEEEYTYATVSRSKTKDTPEILTDAEILNEDSSILMSKGPGTVAAHTVILEQHAEHELEKGSDEDTLSNILPDMTTDSNVALEKEKRNNKDESSAVKLEKRDANEILVADEESEEQQTKYYVDEDGNTYYNTVGKRVPIFGLADYIKNKDHKLHVEEFQTLPQGLQKAYNVAKNPRNATQNRYKLVYPYDESRVILKDGSNDYVNASFIEGYNRPKEYIGSSGPFKREKSSIETVSDFWRMVWQEKCETIIMLTKCYENTEYKCEQYWPELGNSMEYAKLNVTCVTEDQYADFTIRSFVVTKDGENLNTLHLHFTTWPDKGVPTDVTSMIEYRQKVRSLHKEKTCPMIVHCSAGVGRTGTFIALDRLTFMGEALGYVDIFGCVANLRFERAHLVQTSDQYEYLHHAVLHALAFDCKNITAEMFIETYSRLIKKKDGTSKLEAQFQKLQSTLDEMSIDDKTAKDQNGALTDKNREGADIPGDENRVRLFESRKPGASDYINAVYISGFRSLNRFIVAQTPLPTTIVDFLSLIYQVKCSCIVMMEETDLQDQTVGVFWPADNQVIKHGVFQVRCKESKTTQTYILKKLSLMRRVGKKDEAEDVDLFMFTNWPRGTAVPKSSDSLVQLVKDVDTKNHDPDEERPILIHCMTGAERSCLYCAVSVLIEKMEIEHEVSVVNTVRQIKTRRRSAIPTLDQYKFCHQAVISYLQTFDIYSNFGLKSNKSTKLTSK